jgi:hypothetical protein
MGLVDYVHKRPSREKLLRGEMPTWIANSKRSRYIAAVVLSAPPWVSRKDLHAMKAEAARVTVSTGHLHVLAHIVPLNHPLVCGLTVPWNLEIVPWQVNASASNWFTPDQMEMF